MSATWISHREFYARDRAVTNENRRRGRHPAMPMQDYDRQLHPDRVDCAGTLELDPEATGPDEPIVLAVCDECGFEVCVHRSAADPQWRGNYLLLRSDLPFAFIDKPFARSEHNDAAMDVAAAWLEDVTRGKPPALHGPAGVGKTHLLTRTGAALCRDGVRVLYRDYVSLLRQERGYLDRPAGVRPFEVAVEAEVLILDDLGAERPTPWSQEQLQWLIDERYKAGRPLLIGTNLDVLEWPEQLGERAASRLAAMTRPTYMGGADLRLE